MKKILFSVLAMAILGMSSCTKREDSALAVVEEQNFDERARTLDCPPGANCLAPSAPVSSVTASTNCSNILNIKLYLDYNVPIVIEKSSNASSWVPIKYFNPSDYTLSVGTATISFTDLNPYQPAGSPIPTETYYRTKLVLIGSTKYSNIVSKSTVAGCSGLPNTVFSLNPSGGIVTNSFANLKVGWNGPTAGLVDVTGGVTSYSVSYDVKQGSSYIANGNLSVSGSTTSTFIPVSSGPYSGPITVTVTVTAFFASADVGTYTFTKIVNTGGV